jgi:hypothetical protein
MAAVVWLMTYALIRRLFRMLLGGDVRGLEVENAVLRHQLGAWVSNHGSVRGV